jgi:hypothetical protein
MSRLLRSVVHKLRTTSTVSDIILSIAIISAILSFLPVYFPRATRLKQDNITTPNNQQTSSNVTQATPGADDYYAQYYLTTYTTDPFLWGASLSSLIVTIPSSIDVLIDLLPQSFIEYVFGTDQRLIARRDAERSNLHLSLLEMALFVVGMTCISAITFTSVQDYSTVYTLFNCFQNVNTLLCANAILSFLSRCSSFWTAPRTLPICILICLGPLLNSVAYMYDSSSVIYTNLYDTSSFCCVLAAGLCGIFSAVYYYIYLYPIIWDKSASAVGNARRRHQLSIAEAREMANFKFRELIIATHLLALFALLCINACWYWYTLHFNGNASGNMIYCSIGAAVLVFVAEFRMRKHEISSMMVSPDPQNINTNVFGVNFGFPQ